MKVKQTARKKLFGAFSCDLLFFLIEKYFVRDVTLLLILWPLTADHSCPPPPWVPHPAGLAAGGGASPYS